jgi:hypothetical protein
MYIDIYFILQFVDMFTPAIFYKTDLRRSSNASDGDLFLLVKADIHLYGLRRKQVPPVPEVGSLFL